METDRLALASRIETTPNDRPHDRSWNYVTLGHGHDDAFWAEFCRALRRVGYDDVLSIDHEDTSMTPEAGVRESVELLRRSFRDRLDRVGQTTAETELRLPRGFANGSEGASGSCPSPTRL